MFFAGELYLSHETNPGDCRRLTNLEAEVQHLRQQVEDMNRLIRRDSGIQASQFSTDQDPDILLPHLEHTEISTSPPQNISQPLSAQATGNSKSGYPFNGKSGAGICLPGDVVSDFVTRSLISIEYAMLYFQT